MRILSVPNPQGKEGNQVTTTLYRVTFHPAGIRRRGSSKAVLGQAIVLADSPKDAAHMAFMRTKKMALPPSRAPIAYTASHVEEMGVILLADGVEHDGVLAIDLG
jgi:hypothetical protein